MREEGREEGRKCAAGKIREWRRESERASEQSVLCEGKRWIRCIKGGRREAETRTTEGRREGGSFLSFFPTLCPMCLLLRHCCPY